MLPADALVLFDIDGTLIRKAGPHHREALVAAVHRVTGIETTLDLQVLTYTFNFASSRSPIGIPMSENFKLY